MKRNISEKWISITICASPSDPGSGTWTPEPALYCIEAGRFATVLSLFSSLIILEIERNKRLIHFQMPDISKFEDALRGLENGTYRTLGLSVGSKKITSPGLKIPKKGKKLIIYFFLSYIIAKINNLTETQPTPTLFAPPDLPHDATYAVISLDLDAPFMSWNALSPIAHWIQTGLKIDQQHQRELKSAEPSIAPWAAAGPPPFAAPHRYVFLLYHQNPESTVPPNLKDKELTIPQRMRFVLDAMVKQLQLGDLVAVNYFVSN